MKRLLLVIFGLLALAISSEVGGLLLPPGDGHDLLLIFSGAMWGALSIILTIALISPRLLRKVLYQKEIED